MIIQDAKTFVSLGRAVALATEEGALDSGESLELTAALVAALLGGSMEMETYGLVHETLARLLDLAFAGPVRPDPGLVPAAGAGEASEDSLGVYLEVAGQAWETVNGEKEACEGLKRFVRRAFDLSRARFGDGAWFQAPLLLGPDDLMREARASGLLVVSAELQGLPERSLGLLHEVAADGARGPGAQMVLGWGERRVAMDLVPADTVP